MIKSSFNLFQTPKLLALLTSRFSSSHTNILESHMVDVSKKKPTTRTAVTQCLLKLNDEAYLKLKSRDTAKGDPISMAEIAGIMGAKNTSAMVSLIQSLSDLQQCLCRSLCVIR